MPGLRVIAGKSRGRKLRSVPGDSTRPITDLVKEALFNIIGKDIENSAFLDLFAGTGSVGIEALSRGAVFALFIDNNRQAVSTLQANLKSTLLDNQAQILRMDAFTLLARPPSRRFEYVYVAPPQYMGLWKKALLALDAHPDWLADDGWVIVQINPMEEESLSGVESLKILQEIDRRRYGSTLLLFYARANDD